MLDVHAIVCQIKKKKKGNTDYIVKAKSASTHKWDGKTGKKGLFRKTRDK